MKSKKFFILFVAVFAISMLWAQRLPIKKKVADKEPVSLEEQVEELQKQVSTLESQVETLLSVIEVQNGDVRIVSG